MDKNIREKLAELEHKQWESWSRYVANDLCKINHLAVIDRWRSNWKPYSELNEKTKDSDRKWADKVIKLIKKEDVDLAEFLSNRLEYSPELIGDLIKEFRSKNK